VKVLIIYGRVLGKSWPGFKISRVSFPVPCGAMTVIGVSTLPLRRLMPMEQNFR